MFFLARWREKDKKFKEGGGRIFYFLREDTQGEQAQNLIFAKQGGEDADKD